MKRILWTILFLYAVPSFAISVKLTWQLPATNQMMPVGCGAQAGYDCTFLVYRASAASPTTACSTNVNDYQQVGASAANATSYADSTVSQGTTLDSYCYYVVTEQPQGSPSTVGFSAPVFLDSGGSASGSLPISNFQFAHLGFAPILPCRMVDTRGSNGPLGGPAIQSNASRDFPLLSSGCNIPSTAVAYALSITSVFPAGAGYLIAWPTGSPMPISSVVNYSNGAVIGNNAILEAGVNGIVSVYAAQTGTDIVIDCTGYFQ